METARLDLQQLNLTNAEFIFQLVNSQGWVKFIGERNIKNLEDARVYIKKIMDNPTITYWVIYLKEQSRPIGIISLIRRDYLEHADIGFALLPEYEKKGYATEAAGYVLAALAKSGQQEMILAITLKENTQSIRLLEKLGMKLEREMERDKEQLLVYSIRLG
jgi:ribosomal-protein-alanine N-acetyltransferase